MADIRIHKGPSGIKSENARPTAWVYVDLTDTDIGAYVETARRHISERVSLPVGYSMAWSGQYEYLERAQRRLQIVVPVTLAIILLLLYMNFRNVVGQHDRHAVAALRAGGRRVADVPAGL